MNVVRHTFGLLRRSGTSPRRQGIVSWTWFASAWLASLAVGQAAEFPEFAALNRSFGAEIRPILKEYCLGCHSTEKHKGDLDLERFVSVTDVRQHTRVWEKTLEQLHAGEMPPKDKPQPSALDREKLEKWVVSVLNAEGRANAGDPGRVVLRRLSNVEYTRSIQDLTGVPLDPAKEFPIDGAAGEGFVNAGEALVMSPALLDKYLAAGKDVAAHAVLLPDGIQFSASTKRGDWVDERLAAIREFYSRYTDSEGGTRINLQGIQFDTNTGGRLPVERYFLATLEEREALAQGKKTFQAVAQARRLNARYLESLWNLLTQGEPSLLLDGLRARWQKASPSDAVALAADVARWQGVLTRFQTVGHIKPWMVPANPLKPLEEFRLKLVAPTNGNELRLWLVAGDSGDGADQDFVVWQEPRLVIPGRPNLLLRDLRDFAAELAVRRERMFAVTAKCLEAAAEASAAGAHGSVPDRTELSRKHGVDADALNAWLDYLGIGSGAALRLDYFTNRLTSTANYDFVKGWGSPETPSLMANSSDQHVRIPGNMKPRGVVVHPSPKLHAAVGWRSPVQGALRVEARVTHAHPECGNGVTWSLELRRGATRQRLASGVSQGAKEVKVGPVENLSVQNGDLISLLIGPRDGNHSCDLTDVELMLQTDGATGRRWNLTQEVSGDVLAANPHADAFGNEGVWHFYTEPVSGGADAGPVIPAGSLLAQWQSAGAAEEKRRLAGEVQALLLGMAPADKSPNAALYRQLSSLGGPLLAGARPAVGSAAQKLSATAPASKGAASTWGLDSALFGKHPDGSTIPSGSLCVRAPSVIEVRLPADLVEGCDWVVSAALHDSTGANGSAQVRVLTAPPSTQPGPWPGTPILTRDGSANRRRLESAFDEFRRWFPAALCYTKLRPVDEVVTLAVFHREDEPLRRLMLGASEQAVLDRLWNELHFIAQDPLTVVDAYAQLMEYATQDSDPKLFTHLREPILAGAAEFRRTLVDSEPRHLNALLDVATRAYRRPLTDNEAAELRALYRQVREQDVSHDDAFRLTLARVLVSPSFLYKVETPAPGGQAQPVSPWELATRLSYFLWSSLPDSQLRLLAENRRLPDPVVLVSESRRMLQDTRVRALATEFACQWLHIRGFDTHDEKSERHFPTFGGLRADMYEESIRFFVDLFQRDGSVLELLNADHTFLNEALAKHYGIPGVTGNEWRRVDGVKRQGRGGILTMATVLSTQSGASRTSPILRGNWLVETLLGDKLPKPPKNVPQLPDSEADTGDLTLRQTIEKHSSVPECAVCHVRIDPFGFALEQYDAIGRWREKDLGGRDIDPRAQLKWRDDTILNGVEGLRNYLLGKRRDDVVRTFCRKMLGYALGRGLKLTDGPLLEEMQTSLRQNQYRVSAAIETILKSQQFRYQRGLEATKEDEI